MKTNLRNMTLPKESLFLFLIKQAPRHGDVDEDKDGGRTSPRFMKAMDGG
jgi:hypothetical protein